MYDSWADQGVFELYAGFRKKQQGKAAKEVLFGKLENNVALNTHSWWIHPSRFSLETLLVYFSIYPENTRMTHHLLIMLTIIEQ